jgi:ABC-type branched-subunit amino acid transport system ATPase component
LLFAAISTRPNIAFAISRLAKFLNNPSSAHYKAADRALMYLYNTRQLFLRFCGQDNLVVASDASFANNSTDRKGSQAFAIKLFGGLVGWRANKQDTITTSTTEAKLLALAKAAKESIYVSKLLQKLIIDLNDQII